MALRVVFVGDEFLHPKNSGNRVETANEVRLLHDVLGHDVHLLMIRDPWTTPDDERVHREKVPVHTTFFARAPRVAALLARPLLPYHATRRLPAAAERARLLTEIRARGPVDVIVAAHDFMWPLASRLASALGGVPVLVRSHNDEGEYFDAVAAAARSWRSRLIHRAEAVRSRLLARRIGRAPARVAVLSPADARAYRSARTDDVPPLMYDGVLRDDEVVHATPTGRDTMLFVGALNAPLSVEGLEWFVEHVLPGIVAARPGTRLRVVGRGAPDDLRARFSAHADVDYVGEVDDLTAEFDRARVFVNPVLGGSGVNIKMGGPARRGVPIVTSARGMRGLEALRAGVLAAETPAAWARAVIARFDDDAAWLAASRALADGFAATYSVDAVGRAFDRALRLAVDTAGDGPAADGERENR